MVPALIIIAVLLLAGCSGKDSDKIPITTSSSKALDYYLQGRDLFEKLRANEAIEYFEKAIAEDPDFAVAYLNLAFVTTTVQGFFDNLNKAAALMDKVSEGERLWIMGVVAAANGEPMKQRKFFKRMVELYPNDERGLNLLGNHYFGQQEYAHAIELYEQALAITPEFSQPYNQLGYAHRFLNNYEEAEKAFKKYIELIPDDPNPYDSYAELLLKMGKYDESIEHYQKALQVNPIFPASYLGTASNLNYKGEHQAARDELQKLYDNAVNNGQKRAALFGMAVSYVDEGKMKEALAEVEKQYAIAEGESDNPAMANDLNFIANILYEMGKYDDAMNKYTESIEIIRQTDLAPEVKDNSERFYLYGAGRVAVKKGDLKTAREKSTEFMERAMAINNAFHIWLAHELAGEIALAEKEYQLALDEFGKANQQNPYTYYRMGLAYKGMDNKEDAREMFALVAGYNQVNSLNYSFIRNKAKKMMSSL